MFVQLEKMSDTKKEHDTIVASEEGSSSHEVAAEGVLKGALDPVYEAKAHVLNNAVGAHCSVIVAKRELLTKSTDPRRRHGKVSVAVVRGCRFRVCIRQSLAHSY